MPEIRRDWSVDWAGLVFAVSICLCVTLGIAACGDGGGNGVRADSPELQAIAAEQEAFLRATFGLDQDIDVELRTVPSIDAEGRFRAPDGQLYYGRTLPGFHNPVEVEVSDRLFPGVVRHELLHGFGKTHADEIINGVRVSDFVDHWYD